jgi:hypothetical protein
MPKSSLGDPNPLDKDQDELHCQVMPSLQRSRLDLMTREQEDHLHAYPPSEKQWPHESLTPPRQLSFPLPRSPADQAHALSRSMLPFRSRLSGAFNTSLLQSRLLQDAGQTSGSQVITRLPWERYATGFARVLAMTIAIPSGDQSPAVIIHQPNYLAELHVAGGSVRQEPDRIAVQQRPQSFDGRAANPPQTECW